MFFLLKRFVKDADTPSHPCAKQTAEENDNERCRERHGEIDNSLLAAISVRMRMRCFIALPTSFYRSQKKEDEEGEKKKKKGRGAVR